MGELFAHSPVVRSSDASHAEKALSDLYLPVTFSSTAASDEFEMKLNAVTVGAVTCGHMELRSAVRLGTAEAENYHIDIPTAGRATLRADLSAPIFGTTDVAGIFVPGRAVEIVSEERFAQVCLMIQRSRMDLELQSLLGQEARHPLEFDGRLDLGTVNASIMIQALLMIDAASAQENGLLTHPLAMRRIEQAFIYSVLFAQPHNYSTELTAAAPLPGSRAVSRAVEHLRRRPDHPWTVAELASSVSVSVRSLQEGFQRSLNTTPMAYLRRLRLQHVHDELVAAEPGSVSVTEVAFRWGFFHLGRFAAAYRREYGERPSETGRT